MRRIIAPCLLLFCCCFFKASAQGLKPIIVAIDSFHKRQPLEKLYLHLDKPYYAIGDTLRFKAYLLDETLSGSAKSGLMYVELINDSARVVKRQTIKVYDGVAMGDIVIKRTWYAGNYTMRAYTNWMRNFGGGHFFVKTINIITNRGQQWLVNNHVTIDKNRNVNLQLHFNDFAHKNIGFRELQLSVLYGTSSLLKSKTRTDADGNAGINFDIPEKLAGKQLTLLAEDISKEGNKNKITIPIQFNRPENIDLQFMPEGGNLVAGIKTRIGFKAIGEDGKRRDISGKVYDSKQQEVAIFKSTHLGMGSFELTPIVGENYTAKIDMHDGTPKSYTLPVVNPTGIVLRAEPENDSLKITLTAPDSPDSYRDRDASATATYYLIGQARDKVCYAAKISFKDKEVHKEIAKDIFPTGIIKWVLLDAENRPVSQRMVFIDHNDRLNIHINSNKESYRSRDSVVLQFAVTDVNNNPVHGSFSLAVTDDNQVKAPGADAENIASYMLLNADLKGNIEEPGYYFNREHADRATALDNLLLTQGWAGYDWKPVFVPPVKPEYEAETQLIVKGRASNFFNKSVSNTELYLISKKPQLLFKTTTSKDGRFFFSDFPYLDTIDFHIQAQRNFNIGVMVDEFVPPEFTPAKIPGGPWYLDSDSTLVNYANKKQAEQEEAFNAGKSKLLKEVEIKSNRVEPPPPPLLHLEEEEIRNARPGKKPMNLRQLLDRNGDITQMDKTLVIDGDMLVQGARRRSPPATNAQIMAWLQEFTTDDIKAITVKKVYGSRKGFGGVSLIINITTKINMNEGSPPTGGYEYRPMPISWPHRFYSPKYAVKDRVAVKDRRSTIYWDADIVTDAYGKAEVSFYSADTPGSYTAIVQGSDLNGNVGFYSQKIKIAAHTAN